MEQLSRSMKDSDKASDGELEQAPALLPAMRGLQEFLHEAELGEYYSPLVTRLKVATVEHLKYVREEDLHGIGMTRPEMRRLNKFYKKNVHQGTISKIRKAILKGAGDEAGKTVRPTAPTQRDSRPAAPSQRDSRPAAPTQRDFRPLSSSAAPYARVPSKQIIQADSIQFGRTLGQGEFGIVQQGIWRTELGKTLQVAVKRLSRERMHSGTQNFLKEAAIMQDVDHLHIVRMFGAVLDSEDNMMLVTELAPMSSLLECMKDKSLRADLPVTRLCDYAVQVCEGMSYLESKRLVHRDLAARNILVFNKNLVKISDLGLSRLLGVGQDYYQSRFSASLKLPIAWCAPECINFLKFTPASDAWSFAVTLWEFFTYGFQPWAGLSGQQILQAIDEPSCQRLDQPELCTNEIYKLMRECWAHQPHHRPMFSEILLRLPQLKPTQVRALKDYPSPVPEKGYIPYKAGDVIVVINKSPVTSSRPGLIWKGVLTNGKSGLFDPTNAVPFIEPNISTVPGQPISIARKESTRRSAKKIRVDMISHPQNDLRHTGHIGYDGAVFGDVSFIADKLPVKAGPGNASQDPSTLSHGRGSPDHKEHVRYSNSQPESSDKTTNGYGQSWSGQDSVNGQDGRHSPSYLDIDDDKLLSDFKLPSLGSSFDFGPSFMDEVLKALDEKEKQVSSDSASSPNKSHVFDPNLWTASTRREPPPPAPREPRSSTSSALSPAQPQRVEHGKDKKQSRVKSMSASEERMVDTALARARELTSHMIGGSAQSPPVSPSQGSSFFGEDTGLISRLKNSIKRSASPKSEHKRTFSDDLEHKGDCDEVSPEAQQAYNMLVVKGSFKGRSASGHTDVPDSRRSASRPSSKSSQGPDASVWAQPDFMRETRSSSNSSKVVATSSSMLHTGPPSPQTSVTSQSLSKSVGMSQMRAVAISAPVPVHAKTEPRNKLEVANAWSYTDTKKMEKSPTPIVSVSSDKYEVKRQSNFNVPGFRSVEEPKEIIKSVLETDSVYNDAFKNGSSFQHSSQRSSTHHPSTPESEHGDTSLLDVSSQWGKTCQDSDARITLTASTKDSCRKEKMSSIFVDDLDTPTPQEVMKKLRERRLNNHSGSNRPLGSEDEVSVDATTFRSQATSERIPPEGVRVDSSEELDTNPLRMLRGGAIPLRTTGRSSAGMGNINNRSVMALRVPRLNFSRNISSSDTDHQKTDLATGDEAVTEITVVAPPSPQSPAADAMATDVIDESSDCTIACVALADENSTNHQADQDSLQVTNVDVAVEDIKTNAQPDLSQLVHTDLTESTPTRSQPCLCVDSHTLSHEAQTNADDCSQSPTINRNETATPPRLPPRRSQSLNENTEKSGAYLSVVCEGLRRSNSFEKDCEAPALPPRRPHAGRTPLNIRPRERKFPLQIHLPSQDKDSKQQPTSPRPNSKHILQLKSPAPTSPNSPIPLSPRQQPLMSATPSRQQASLLGHHQPSDAHSPSSPSRVTHHRHPLNSNSFMSHSLDSSTMSHLHHHSNSVDLPPAYDISHRHPTSSDVADSEPTHMLLDVHTLNLPLPLSVSLPPSSDLSAIDEPTHVSLSSLIDNKHSWSAAVTSASPATNHRQHISSHSAPSSSSPRLTRVFERAVNNDTRIRAPLLYPDSSDNQSPPADLPPAPPTPSYREKLRFEQQKPKVVRSISHTPHKHQSGSHLLAVDSPSIFRARSASTNSPASRSHHTDAPTTQSTQPTSHRVFPHRSYPTDDEDNDDAFFAEAPTDPHPYSQTPFHPLIPSSPKDGPQSSSVYSTISLLQASPDLSPYLVSSSVSQSNQSSSSSCPLASRLSGNSSRQDVQSNDTLPHTSDKHTVPQLVLACTNSTHLYNTVSLPTCNHFATSPDTSRTSTKNCTTKSVSSISHRPGLQTTSKQILTSSTSNCQGPALNVFRFPSTVRGGGSLITPSSSVSSWSATRARNLDSSPGMDDPSSSEVSPLMFASYTAASSVSYEDLRQFAFDRQKNCEEIETLLKIFSDQVTVDECMTALESTQWDVARATKYLQLKKLLSLGVADVHKCKEALSASGWDLQCAAESLLESSRTMAAATTSSRGTSARSTLIAAHNRPTTPEIVDV